MTFCLKTAMKKVAFLLFPWAPALQAEHPPLSGEWIALCTPHGAVALTKERRKALFSECFTPFKIRFGSQIDPF